MRTWNPYPSSDNISSMFWTWFTPSRQLYGLRFANEHDMQNYTVIADSIITMLEHKSLEQEAIEPKPVVALDAEEIILHEDAISRELRDTVSPTLHPPTSHTSEASQTNLLLQYDLAVHRVLNTLEQDVKGSASILSIVISRGISHCTRLGKK